MPHRDYRNAGFNDPRRQSNIMAFVGNGFDIQALRDYDSPIDTRYASFYHFLKLRSFNEENPILQEMEELRKTSNGDWSDVERVAGELLAEGRVHPRGLIDALREMQGQFSEFLNLAAPSDLLTRLGADSMNRGLAIKSLAGFLGDLDQEEYRRIRFPQGIDNFDMYNFVFINFNYTPLFDDFIYLDQVQFDPLPHRTVDRNFDFKGNPKHVAAAPVRPGDYFSSYLMTDVVHPHGHQSIPRSLLFGIDEPTRVSGNADPALRLAKPFWAQNDHRYEHLFIDTELFIVFGCSLGDTDQWWWRHIAESLGRERERLDDEPGAYRPELIIYWYAGGAEEVTKADVREKFVRAAGVDGEASIMDYIHVVLHDESTDRVWLNTSRQPRA